MGRPNGGFVGPQTYASVGLDAVGMDRDARQFTVLEHHDDTSVIDEVDLFAVVNLPLFDNRADTPF
jgi:hypothetical protein